MKITIVGAGYVGLSLSVLFAQKYNTVTLDIDQNKVNLINKGISPIKDKETEEYLKSKKLNLLATVDKDFAYKNSDFVIVATPTNYDAEINSFNTSQVEEVIGDALSFNKDAVIVIKSTVPIGFTNKMHDKFKTKKIFFSPEFLREGNALFDNLNPSRIVIGDVTDEAAKFGEILLELSYKEKISTNIHYMKSIEAEAVKLFSNTYLAMRVAFFNELDTFAEINNLDTKKIIQAVSDDARIGNHYNNPSFGYGGYCLPKDTKQLLDNYKGIPNNLIRSIIDSNQTRKEHIAKSILDKSKKSVGFYKLAMKADSDNFRESAVLDLINILVKRGIKINLYEPLADDDFLKKVNLFRDLKSFASSSDIIIANRLSNELRDYKDKVYSRDIFLVN